MAAVRARKARAERLDNFAIILAVWVECRTPKSNIRRPIIGRRDVEQRSTDSHLHHLGCATPPNAQKSTILDHRHSEQ